MNRIVLTELFVYPIKGARGISLERGYATARGIEHDRRFMLIDANGDFLTQRDHTEIALIETGIDGDALVVKAHGQEPLRLPLRPQGKADRKARVWDDVCDAVSLGQTAAEYFSDCLKRPAELVYMPDETKRLVSKSYANRGETVGFSDGFPFLLVNEGSLEDLNARLEKSVPMNRFRANFVVRGAPAWSEDSWTCLQIDDVVFFAVKPCSRCQVITVDQATGERGKDPLATLATFRARANKVYFGWNLVAENEGEVRAGSTVSLLSRSYDRDD